jgi:hypothetical protein
MLYWYLLSLCIIYRYQFLSIQAWSHGHVCTCSSTAISKADYSIVVSFSSWGQQVASYALLTLLAPRAHAPAREHIFFFFEIKARPSAWPAWDTSSMYYMRKPNATRRMTYRGSKSSRAAKPRVRMT